MALLTKGLIVTADEEDAVQAVILLSEKKCWDCGLVKPIDQFYASQRGPQRARCKACAIRAGREGAARRREQKPALPVNGAVHPAEMALPVSLVGPAKSVMSVLALAVQLNEAERQRLVRLLMAWDD